MAAYCAQADLVERFGSVELAQLTDEAAAATPDAVEIGKVCDETTSLIDSYLSSRYAVPLSPVPTLIRKLACDIARKMLWKDRADSGHAVNTAYNEALRILRDIAKGVSGLPDATGIKAPAISGIAYTRPSAVFNTDGLL